MDDVSPYGKTDVPLNTEKLAHDALPSESVLAAGEADATGARPAAPLPLPGSLSLATKMGRRRFLRRTADGLFGGVAAVALGRMTLPHLVRSIPMLPNVPSDCESQTGPCCPSCCGPDPCCGTSCCGVGCCEVAGSHVCYHCANKGDWGGYSCWSHVYSTGYVVVCCDCAISTASCTHTGICICSSVSRYSPEKHQWLQFNPVENEWLPVNDPFADLPVKAGVG
jgi:hypothetical protein